MRISPADARKSTVVNPDGNRGKDHSHGYGEKQKYGDICDTLKWITPAEIDEIDYIIFDTVRHITDKGKSAAHLELMPKGTVLLSSRAPIGKLAITGSEMTCNQGFKNLIPKDRITPIFLYYYLKGIISEIQSLGRGATFKEVSKSIVANIKILVPSKREQIAFNSFIEQLDKSKFRAKKCLKLFSCMRHLWKIEI